MEYNMIFVLGYDLLHDKLTSCELPCDEAFGVCEDVYEKFLESDKNKPNMSEYDALKEYVSQHEGTVDYLIEVACRNVTPCSQEKTCIKDDSYICSKEHYTTCYGCPLGDAIDNRYPKDDC